MFMNVTRRLGLRATAPMLQQTLPDAFSFYKGNAVVDKDLTSAFEPLENLKFTLTRQDAWIYKQEGVKSVSLSTDAGDIGVLPGHEYKVAKIKPSVITVEKLDGTLEKFFTSGGMAHINNEGSCDVNTVECLPVESLDKDLVEKNLTKANADLLNAKDDKSKSVAEIQIELLEAAKASFTA